MRCCAQHGQRQCGLIACYPCHMSDINYTSLSKAISKVLRHQPERLGLTLAPDGSVSLPALIDALNARGGWPRAIDIEDVMHVVEHGTKQRFAVEDGRIRARYGHTLPVAVPYEQAQPPAVRTGAPPPW